MGRAWASGEEGCQHLGTAFRENRAGWRVTPGGKRCFLSISLFPFTGEKPDSQSTPEARAWPGVQGAPGQGSAGLAWV